MIWIEIKCVINLKLSDDTLLTTVHDSCIKQSGRAG